MKLQTILQTEKWEKILITWNLFARNYFSLVFAIKRNDRYSEQILLLSTT